jgi:hypothetical protein
MYTRLSIAALATLALATTEPPSSTAPTASDETVLFDEPFDDDRNGWGIIDHPDYGGTSYDNGDYVWNLTGSSGHLIAEVLGVQYDNDELDMLDVTIRAELTIDSGNGVAGVFCREVPDSDADWQWYEFVVRDGWAAVRLADLEGNIDVIAETDDVDVAKGVPFAIEATCADDADGVAQLSLSIDDERVLTAEHDDPLGNGVPGLQAWTYPVHALMEIRWHDFTVVPATAD